MSRTAKAVLSCGIFLVSVMTSNASSYSLPPAPQKPVSYTYKTYTYSPTPSDLNDLDHHSAYTWRLDNLKGLGPNFVITGATLTFTHIANWDNTANRLFVHLLDTAKYSGVRSFTDATGSPVPSSQIHDNFADPYLNTTNSHSSHYNPLIVTGTGNTSATGNTYLFDRSFTMTPTTYTFTFTAAELVILQNYINHGHDIAFGFDPDCHYFNNGIVFKYTVRETMVPDLGSTAGLMTTAVGLLFFLRRKLRA